LVHPRCEESEDIAEEEEYRESDEDIHSPGFEIGFCLDIITSCECPCDTEPDDTEYSEEEDDIDEVSDNLSKY
jgi:hypothetical protein